MKIQTNRGLAPLAIVGIIALVVVVGGGIYFAMQNDASVDGGDEIANGSGTDAGALDLSGSGTLRALFALGQDITCTFSGADERGTSAGTIYVANRGDRIRADFEYTNEGEGRVEGHMIKDGDVAHFWGNQLETGITVSAAEGDVPEGSGDDDGSIDYDSNVEYECDTWREDASMFQKPGDVEFMSLGDFGAQIQQEAGIEDFDQCAACDSLPNEEAKNSCKQSLGCN